MRREVEQLLADYKDGEFLEGRRPAERRQARSARDSHPHPADPSTLTFEPLSHSSRQIGPYRIRELLGEGGMGSVYVAEQEQPVRRKVALKIIKPGMGSREVISRFESERQALAMMDHQNIARILDAGATEQGLPFFVMELVRGLPITQHCDQRKLGIRDRLTLFIDVCHAIQHAHLRGVIHRDIKPSNVLVTLHDGKPVVKVIDFGVAKALHQPLSQHTIYTALNQVIGTPLYMSPEQLELSGLDIDTRTDIYSLGVLLYELLAGRTPFDHEHLMKSGFDEMRRIIREDEPLRPSQRVTTLPKAELTTAANRRGLDERSFSKAVQNELDWITLKAMEKDRSRRYESASEMAADIQRYLNDEAVLACPPSARYRFSKFAHRNWIALTTTAIVAATLATGTGISSWQAIRATRAERRADSLLAETRHAVDEMYTGVAEEWLNQQPNLTEVQHEFLQKALTFYDRLATTQDTTPDLRYERAKAFRRVGAIQAKFGQYDAAMIAYRNSIAEINDLVQLFPDRQDYRFLLAACRTQLASSLRESGNDGLAKEQALLAHADLRRLEHDPDALQKDQVELASTLGMACHQLTQAKCLTEAKELADRELLICQALVAASPGDYKCQSALAGSYTTLGSHLLWWGQQNDEAEAAFRKALSQLEILEQQRPNDARNRQNLAGVLWNLGVVLTRKQKQHPDLEGLYRRSLEIFNGLVRDFPDYIEYRDGLATMHSKLAGIDHIRGRHAESESHYRAALEIYESCAKSSTDGPRFEIRVCNMLDGLSGQLTKQRKVEEASAVYRRWAEYSRAMYKRHQDSNTERTRPQVIRSSLQLASILLHQKNHVEASQAIDDLPQYFAETELRESPDEVGAMLHARAVLLSCVTLAQNEQNQRQERTEHAVQDYLSRAETWHELAALSANRWAATVEAEPGMAGWTIVDLCEFLLSQAEQTDDLFPDQPDGTREAHQLLASSVIQHAVKKFPDDPSLHLIADFLSTAPDGFRDKELALQLTERCLKLNPADELTIQSRVWALFRNQEWSQCVADAASLKDRSASDFVLAMAHWQLGHKSEAGELLQSGQSWLVGYERRSEERLQEGKLTHPSPNMLQRLENEAIRLIDVSTNP
ncbi:MAG: serine/threonine-protein kinase [Pirellulales bacterium]